MIKTSSLIVLLAYHFDQMGDYCNRDVEKKYYDFEKASEYFKDATSFRSFVFATALLQLNANIFGQISNT